MQNLPFTENLSSSSNQEIISLTCETVIVREIKGMKGESERNRIGFLLIKSLDKEKKREKPLLRITASQIHLD